MENIVPVRLVDLVLIHEFIEFFALLFLHIGEVLLLVFFTNLLDLFKILGRQNLLQTLLGFVSVLSDL